MSASPSDGRVESYVVDGGEGGQAVTIPEGETRESLVENVPFGDRLPAAAFLVAAAVVGVLLLALLVTPLNR